MHKDRDQSYMEYILYSIFTHFWLAHSDWSAAVNSKYNEARAAKVHTHYRNSIIMCVPKISQKKITDHREHILRGNKNIMRGMWLICEIYILQLSPSDTFYDL